MQRPNTVLLREPTPDELLDTGPDSTFQPPSGQADYTLRANIGGDNFCHNAAVVTTVLPPTWTGVKERSWLFADDNAAATGVKAEVYVARIAKLQIETTAKAVAVGSAETLRVKAVDTEGEMSAQFTTITNAL